MSEINEKEMMFRHSMSHVLAKAIKELYGSSVKLAIGPAIDNGFYYDFDIDRSIGNDDFSTIENKMKDVIERRLSKKIYWKLLYALMFHIKVVQTTIKKIKEVYIYIRKAE